MKYYASISKMTPLKILVGVFGYMDHDTECYYTPPTHSLDHLKAQIGTVQSRLELLGKEFDGARILPFGARPSTKKIFRRLGPVRAQFDYGLHKQGEPVKLRMRSSQRILAQVPRPSSDALKRMAISTEAWKQFIKPLQKWWKNESLTPEEGRAIHGFYVTYLNLGKIDEFLELNKLAVNSIGSEYKRTGEWWVDEPIEEGFAKKRQELEGAISKASVDLKIEFLKKELGLDGGERKKAHRPRIRKRWRRLS